MERARTAITARIAMVAGTVASDSRGRANSDAAYVAAKSRPDVHHRAELKRSKIFLSALVTESATNSPKWMMHRVVFIPTAGGRRARSARARTAGARSHCNGQEMILGKMKFHSFFVAVIKNLNLWSREEISEKQ